METLKQEAISAITKLPDSADIDEIMHRPYGIDKAERLPSQLFYDHAGNTLTVWFDNPQAECDG